MFQIKDTGEKSTKYVKWYSCKLWGADLCNSTDSSFPNILWLCATFSIDKYIVTFIIFVITWFQPGTVGPHTLKPLAPLIVLIDWLWLIICCFTSRSRIFHLYGDITIAGEGLQNLGLCSALRAFEQGGILLWHGTLVFPVSSEGPPHLVAFYDTHGGRWSQWRKG
jgi:hypothetical protein